MLPLFSCFVWNAMHEVQHKPAAVLFLRFNWFCHLEMQFHWNKHSVEVKRLRLIFLVCRLFSFALPKKMDPYHPARFNCLLSTPLFFSERPTGHQLDPSRRCQNPWYDVYLLRKFHSSGTANLVFLCIASPALHKPNLRVSAPSFFDNAVA